MPTPFHASSNASSAADEPAISLLQRVAGNLHHVERSLRGTYLAISRLSEAVAELHADLNLGGLAGHQVFTAVSGASADVAQAMARIAGGHRQLELLAHRYNINIDDFGDGQKPPPIPLTSGELIGHEQVGG